MQRSMCVCVCVLVFQLTHWCQQFVHFNCSNRNEPRMVAAAQQDQPAAAVSGPPGRSGQHVRAPATAASCSKCDAAALPAIVAARALAIASATCNRVRSSRTSVRTSVPPTTMCPTMAPCTNGRRTTIMSNPVP